MKNSINEPDTIQDIDENIETGLLEINPDIVTTYQLSKSVKTFALVDFILNLPYLILSPWYCISLLFSISGYVGAKKYNNRLTYVYLLFQVFSIVGRVSLTMLFYNNTTTTYNTGLYVSNILLTIILTVLDAYIARFTVKLIQYIRKLRPHELAQLKEDTLIKTTFLYW